MKKLLIIAVASCFTFISCSKVEPAPQRITSSVASSKPGFAPTQYLLTNKETNWGVVEYRVEYTDVNLVVHNVPLLMGQSITICLGNTNIKANFAFTLVAIGIC